VFGILPSFLRPALISFGVLLGSALAGSSPEASAAFVSGRLESGMGGSTHDHSPATPEADLNHPLPESALLQAGLSPPGGIGSQGMGSPSSPNPTPGGGMAGIAEARVPPPLLQADVVRLKTETLPANLLITSIFEPPRA
jgi:hypothetical protein